MRFSFKFYSYRTLRQTLRLTKFSESLSWDFNIVSFSTLNRYPALKQIWRLIGLCSQRPGRFFRAFSTFLTVLTCMTLHFRFQNRQNLQTFWLYFSPYEFILVAKYTSQGGAGKFRFSERIFFQLLARPEKSLGRF